MNLIERPECYILLTDHPKIKVPWFIPFSKIQIKVHGKFTQILGEVVPERYNYSFATVNLLNWLLQPRTILGYFTLHTDDAWAIEFNLNPYRIQHLGANSYGDGNTPQIGLLGHNTNLAEAFVNGYMSENILVQVE
jgi:hypothetical protein